MESAGETETSNSGWIVFSLYHLKNTLFSLIRIVVRNRLADNRFYRELAIAATPKEAHFVNKSLLQFCRVAGELFNFEATENKICLKKQGDGKAKRNKNIWK